MKRDQEKRKKKMVVNEKRELNGLAREEKERNHMQMKKRKGNFKVKIAREEAEYVCVMI